MAVVKFYLNDPDAPKTTRPAHLGVNAIILWDNKLLLEKRRDSNTWGLIGGGVKRNESQLQAITREIYEELGFRVQHHCFTKIGVYGDPGRIAAYQDGSVWRMVIIMYKLKLSEKPTLQISKESNDIQFFSKEELKCIEIAPTHRDIICDHFLKQGSQG